MSWLLSVLLLAVLATSLLIWVEQRMERRRRLRRMQRLIERYGAFYVANYKDPRP